VDTLLQVQLADPREEWVVHNRRGAVAQRIAVVLESFDFCSLCEKISATTLHKKKKKYFFYNLTNA
jgi:hypothetical protein